MGVWYTELSGCFSSHDPRQRSPASNASISNLPLTIKMHPDYFRSRLCQHRHRLGKERNAVSAV